MHPLQHQPLLHRCSRWVLALWCCVLLASSYAPIARAQHVLMEPVCTSGGAHYAVPSPVNALLHSGMPAAEHALDCPLCLPVLAPPPWLWAVPPSQQLDTALLLPAYRSPCCYRASAMLPARGPPASSWHV